MDIKITRKFVKNLTLKVRINGEVELTAPKNLSETYIKVFLKRKKLDRKKLKEISREKQKKIYIFLEKKYFI